MNDLFQYVWNAVIFLVRCLWTQINYTMSNIFIVKTVIFTKKLDYDIIQSVRQPPCNDKICNSNYIIKRFLSRSLSPFSVIKALHFRMKFFVADYWEIHSRIKIPWITRRFIIEGFFSSILTLNWFLMRQILPKKWRPRPSLVNKVSSATVLPIIVWRVYISVPISQCHWLLEDPG